MKKLFALGLIAALSLTSAAEAKRGGGFKMVKAKPKTSQTQKKQQDADFNTTPNTLPNNAAAQAQQRSQGMGNFVTGAAAGYLLSNVLAPSEAQAQEKAPVQAETSVASVANPAEKLTQQVRQMPTVQTFKSIDPNEPNLIERNAHFSRYCLNGVQYLASQGQMTLMVDRNNTPAGCAIEP